MMKRKSEGFSREGRPMPRIRGVVVKSEGDYLWLREGMKDPVQVAVREPERFQTGDIIVFTTTGAWGVKQQRGTFVPFGVVEKVEVPEVRTTLSEREKQIILSIAGDDAKGTGEPTLLPPEDVPPTDDYDPEYPFGRPESQGEEGAALKLEGAEARAESEVALYEEGTQESADALTKVERERAGTPDLPAQFDEERRQFFVRIGKSIHYLVNSDAKSLYILPGDRVAVIPGPGRKMRIAEVEYRSTHFIAGFVKKGERDVRDTEGNKIGTEEYLYLSVRAPGPRRTLEKFKLPADFPGAEDAEKDGRIILIDRRTKELIDHPDFHKESSSYEALKRVVLTNMGAFQYDEKSDDEKQAEQEEIAWLAKEYGVTDLNNSETLDAQLEPVLSRLADLEVAEGKIIDMRDDKDGKRHTFYIDPNGSRDHDDALSLEDKGDGHYEVGVHIADVERFVKAGSALDLQAAFRASSIYLDDEVIRMLPPLLSEHLASLNAGTTRFAFSLLFDVEQDDKKHVRITNIRFARTVIRVTEGLTYDDAEARIEDKSKRDKGTEALRDLMEIARDIRRRMGIRQMGDDESDPGQMDVHEMVAEFMTLKNRAAGAAYEQLKNAPEESSEFTNSEGVEVKIAARPHLRRVQDLVRGVYRTQELKSEEAETAFVTQLLELGVLFPADLTRRDKNGVEQKVPFEQLARLAHERAMAGEFYAPRKEGGELQEPQPEDRVALSKSKVEAYFSAAYSVRKSSAGYSAEEGTHISMGSIRFSRVTSPIRRKADGDGQRRLMFLVKLNALPRDKDISQEEAIEYAREYARDVVGVTLPESVFNAPFDVLMDEIEKAAEARDKEVFAHDSAREAMAQQAERVVASMHTATNLYSYIYTAKDEEDVEWDRDTEREPERSFRMMRDWKREDGEVIKEGLVIDLVEDNVRVGKDGNVYGEVLISRRSNRALLRYVPGRVKDAGVRLSVRFVLPKGFRHPMKWCKEQGMLRPRVKIPGAVIGVEVEQGRLVFRVDKKLSEKDAYLSPKDPPFRRPAPQRRRMRR